MTIIKGVNISFNIVGDYSRCIRVFKLLVYLSTKTCTVVLLKTLYAHNLLLLRLPSCPIAVAVYRVSIKFPF